MRIAYAEGVRCLDIVRGVTKKNDQKGFGSSAFFSGAGGERERKLRRENGNSIHPCTLCPCVPATCSRRLIMSRRCVAALIPRVLSTLESRQTLRCVRARVVPLALPFSRTDCPFLFRYRQRCLFSAVRCSCPILVPLVLPFSWAVFLLLLLVLF